MMTHDSTTIATYLNGQPGAKPGARVAVSTIGVQAAGAAILRDNCAACPVPPDWACPNWYQTCKATAS